MYRTYRHEERTVNGVHVIINQLRWVDGERTYEVVNPETQKVLPGGGDFLRVPSDQAIAELLQRLPQDES